MNIVMSCLAASYFFGKLAELSDAGVKVTWLIGNHDIWIFDYLPAELGIEVVDGVLTREIGGKLFCNTWRRSG